MDYLLTFLLACLVTCCVAPKCFDCNQKFPGCGENFQLKNSDAAECDGTCIKRRGARTVDGVREVDIHRTCVVQTDDGCHDATWNGISVEACTCNTDFCNAGTSAHPVNRHTPLLIGAFVALFCYWML